MRRWTANISLATAGMLVASTAFAATFPDVPEGHNFQRAVEQLASSGVIGGDPDGNYYPDRGVNRAEIVKMLYKATGKVPDPTNVRCFPDVVPGSWYEAPVCDAAANQYVVGYVDGTFQPEKMVNRVEALKIIQEISRFTVPEINSASREMINFVDVSTSAWYTKYLINAYTVGILPIPAQDPLRFFPENVLLRGEAAAMIYNAEQALIREGRKQAESLLQDDGSDSDASDDTDTDGNDNDDATGSGDTGGADTTADDDLLQSVIIDTTFPLNEHGKFTAKQPYSFNFTLDEPKVVSTIASLQSGQSGSISCVLSLVEGGYSEEYFIGSQRGNTCEMLTALTPGSYQLRIQPSSPDTTFTVRATVGTGDGNDGFSEAKLIRRNVAYTITLRANNFSDWYTFSVDQDSERLKLEQSNTANLKCIIYPMNDVDIFGPELPQCNQFYDYPRGTYYFAVTRDALKATHLTYTVILRQ